MSTVMKGIFSYLLCIALTATAIALLPGVHPHQFQQTNCISSMGSWCPTIEPATNAFYPWRFLIPPLIFGETSTAHSDWLLTLRILCGILLSIGFVFLLRNGSHFTARSPRGVILLGCVSSLFLITVIGGDLVTLCCIAFMPLLIGLLQVSSLQQDAQTRLAVIGVLVLMSFFANQLTIVVALFSMFLWACTRGIGNGEPASGSLDRVALLLMVLVSGIALLTTPNWSIPWYPQGSQVVPDDEIPGMLRPFVGPLPPVPFIHRLAVKDFFIPLFHFGLIAGLLAALIVGRQRRARASLLLAAGLPLTLLYLDLRLPEQVSIISPLLVLPRLLPHTFFFPFEPLAIGTVMLGIILTLIARPTVIRLMALVGLPVLQQLAFYSPLVQSPYEISAPAERWSSPERYSRHLSLLTSPSQFVLTSLAWDSLGSERNWVLEREQLIREASFTPLKESDVLLTASHNASELPRLFTRNKEDRWTAGQGQQKGNEWVQARFQTPQILHGVELYLGPYVTDFPRGIRVSAANSCENSPTTHPNGFHTIVEHKAWYGGVEFTPADMPFFRGRFSVRIFFPEPVPMTCLLLEQIGSSEGSDWSIAELRVLF